MREPNRTLSFFESIKDLRSLDRALGPHSHESDFALFGARRKIIPCSKLRNRRYGRLLLQILERLSTTNATNESGITLAGAHILPLTERNLRSANSQWSLQALEASTEAEQKVLMPFSLEPGSRCSLDGSNSQHFAWLPPKRRNAVKFEIDLMNLLIGFSEL